MSGSRSLPACGHRRLAECPLSADDWRSVWVAYLGFLHTCCVIAEAAHEREATQ